MSTPAFAAFITILLCGSVLVDAQGLYGSVITSLDGWYKIDTASMISLYPVKVGGYYYQLNFTSLEGFACGGVQTYVCAYTTTPSAADAKALTTVGPNAVYLIKPGATKNAFEILFKNPATNSAADITFTYNTDSAPASIATVTQQSGNPSNVLLTVTTNHILAEVMDDPNFVGFYGQAYKINGADRKAYTIIADTDLFVNAKFHHMKSKYLDHSEYPAGVTNMVTIGVQYQTIKLEFLANDYTNHHWLLVNGNNVFTFVSDVSTDPTQNAAVKNVFGPPMTFHNSSGQVIATLTQIYYDLFKFSTAPWDIYVDFKTYYQNSATHPVIKNLNYFNIEAALNDHLRNPGGLLGQTAHKDNPQPAPGTQGAGVIKGKPSDYVVPDVFTHPPKFTYKP